MTDQEKLDQMNKVIEEFFEKAAKRVEAAKSTSNQTENTGGTTEASEDFGDDSDEFGSDYSDGFSSENDSEGSENSDNDDDTFAGFKFDDNFDDASTQRSKEPSNSQGDFKQSKESSDDDDTFAGFKFDGDFKDASTQKSQESSNSQGGSQQGQESSQSFDNDSFNEFMSNIVKGFNAYQSMYDSEQSKQTMHKERQSNKKPKQCDENVIFKKNTITFNGKSFEYRILQREVNWGTAFAQSFTMDDKITNLDKLNEKIIEDIKLTFGDLNRITDIAVVSGMLILNGVQYYPLCGDKDFLNGLPFDCADYFKEGLIAEIFDFGYLYRMPYLTNLKIDSIDFVTRKFAYDIGINDDFEVYMVFKAFKNLKIFELADETFKVSDFNKKSGKLKNNSNTSNNDDDSVSLKLELMSKVDKIYNGFIIGNISTFRNWTFNNLKTYACNRKSGYLPYFGGIVARGGLTVAVGVGELGLRTVGAVAKGVRLLKKAFTDDI